MAATLPSVRTGCAGWGYDDWVGRFYAPGTGAGDYLRAYARVFDTVEVDSTYYRAPSLAQVARWAEATPPGFTFCPKVPEQIVRTRHLRDVEELVHDFLAALAPLRAAGKLGPVVAQMPPSLVAPKHHAALRAFLDLVPRGFELAVELRHASWWTPDTYAALRDRRAALVWSWTEYGATPPERTAEWAYLRLVGDRVLTRFDRPQRDGLPLVRSAVDRLREAGAQLERAFVIANNHVGGFAPHTANEIREALGLPPFDLQVATRAPSQRGLGDFS